MVTTLVASTRMLYVGSGWYFGGHTTLISLPSHLGQLSHLSSVGWEMSTGQRAVMFCGWKVRQDGSFHMWINVWEVGKYPDFGGYPNFLTTQYKVGGRKPPC